MLTREKIQQNSKGKFIVIGSLLMIVGIALLSFSYFQEKKFKLLKR